LEEVVTGAGAGVAFFFDENISDWFAAGLFFGLILLAFNAAVRQQ
jgi:hypothetical protein